MKPMLQTAQWTLLASVLASSANAAPVFSSSSQVLSFGGTVDYNNTGAGIDYDDGNGGIVHAGAFAGPAGLGGYGSAEVVGGNLEGRGNAYAAFDDFVIQGPGGAVLTSLNLDLSGTIGASSNGSSSFSRGNAVVGLRVIVNSQVITDSTYVYTSTGGGGPTFGGSGVFQNWSPPSGLLTTPQFYVQTGTPFSLSIGLSVTATAISLSTPPPGNLTSAEAQFAHTLTFATAGNVFNLPSGYTANSAGAGIQNNLYVVPEASTVALVGATGIAFLFHLARRRQKPDSNATHSSFREGN